MMKSLSHIWSRIAIISSRIRPLDHSWTRSARLLLRDSLDSNSDVRASEICVWVAPRWFNSDAWCATELLKAFACSAEVICIDEILFFAIDRTTDCPQSPLRPSKASALFEWKIPYPFQGTNHPEVARQDQRGWTNKRSTIYCGWKAEVTHVCFYNKVPLALDFLQDSCGRL